MTGTKQKHIFAAIGIMLILWTIYTQFFASIEAKRFIDYYHFDKVMHLLGGFMVTGLAIRYFKVPKVLALILLIFIIVGWEVFEILFIPDVQYFFANLYRHWLRDTLGDIVIGIIGGSSYVLVSKFYGRALAFVRR